MAEQEDTSTTPESPDLSIRAPRGRVAGIRKQYVRVALILLVTIVAVALVVGLGIDFRVSSTEAKREVDLPPRETKPPDMTTLPDNYAEIPEPPEAPDPQNQPKSTKPETEGEKQPDGLRTLKQQNTELRRNLASMMSAIKKIDAENKKLLKRIDRYQQQSQAQQTKAWQSKLFFKIDNAASKRKNNKGNTPVPQTPQASVDGSFPPTQQTNSEAASRSKQPKRPKTPQQRKRSFLRETTAPEARLDQPYLYPSSPYEVQAGTVIPAALLTGINTDLPGEVIATVTSPVYDSATGKHLLIPQGAKLLGTYDSEIGNAQNRALLVWHRLLMPSGRSITLNNMAGTDAAGYAGVADRVDYHPEKLAAGAALSSILAYAGNLARGSSGGEQDARDVVGDTVAQEANRIGSRIIDRQLDVQPTIKVRPGWPVRVLVNKDIRLAPYQPPR